MDLDDRLKGGGLAPVHVDADAALAAVSDRGRRSRRRRRAVLTGAAGLVLVAATGGALVAGLAGDDGRARVTTSPPDTVSSTPVSGPEPSTTATTVVVPTEPEPGDDAVWRVDPAMPPAEDATSFGALVSRVSCNSGVTGEVLRPGVRFEDARVVVEFTVAHDADGGTCPLNDEVPFVVELGRPLGRRTIVDAACLEGGSQATTAMCSVEYDWPSTRWEPSTDPIVTEVPGGPALDPGSAEAAVEVVEAFLADLRVGRFEAAAARWTGYPGGPDDPVEVVRRLAEDRPDLVADADPDVFVLPSPGFTAAVPVVTVRTGEGTDARAVAFVVGVDGSGARIERLPWPDQDGVPTAGGWTTIDGVAVPGGRRVQVWAWSIEGGVRVFVDGDEVPTTYDDLLGTVLVTIPEGPPGAVTVTVVSSTPELPGATTWTVVRR